MRSLSIIDLILKPTRPISRIHSLCHQMMKGRKRPIAHPLDQAMLERIDMHIIHVRRKILVVANQMLPIAPLPNPTFAATQPCRRAPLLSRQRFGESDFNQSPAHRKISIALRQFNHAMHMLRQHNPRMYRERMRQTNRSNRIPKKVDVPHQKVVVGSLQEIHGEKIGAAKAPCAALIDALRSTRYGLRDDCRKLLWYPVCRVLQVLLYRHKNTVHAPQNKQASHL